MLILLKIAVTGGVSSGKTSVCQVFADHGSYVVDADKIVHSLLSPDTLIGKEVIALIGADIVVANGTVGGRLDRGLIAERVFSCPEMLIALEKILHPAVQKEINKIYKSCSARQSPFTFFVVEIPLLYEACFESFYDVVVAVIANPGLCRMRFMNKTGYSSEEYDKRMRRQLPMERKAALANYSIYNNGDLTQLEEDTLNLIKELSLQ